MSNNKKDHKSPITIENKGNLYLFIILAIVIFVVLISLGVVFNRFFLFSISYVFILVILFAVYYFSSFPKGENKGYIIKDDAIAIKTFWFDKKIPFSQIKRILYRKELEKEESKPSFHPAATLMMNRPTNWGYLHIKGFGGVYSYCTRWHDFVIISTAHYKPFILSPDNPHEFIKELKKKMQSKNYELYICRSKQGFFAPERYLNDRFKYSSPTVNKRNRDN